MSDSSPNLVLEFSGTKEAGIAQLRLLFGDYQGWLWARHSKAALYSLAPGIAGALVAWECEAFTLAVIIGFMVVVVAWNAVQNYRLTGQQWVDGTRQFVGMHTRLEIDERGFTEHDQGVVSFCPWSAMKNYCIFESVLFVELANGLWSIIPAATLKPESVTLDQIEAILVKHGVAPRA